MILRIFHLIMVGSVKSPSDTDSLSWNCNFNKLLVVKQRTTLAKKAEQPW
jgi:hypothetical protein